MPQNNSMVVRSGSELAAPIVDWARIAPMPPRPLRDVGRMLARRGKLIVFILLVVNTFAFVMVHRLTPRFTAEADLMISPRQQQVVDLKAVLAGLSGDSDVIESEIQVLRSREVARGIVQQLNLDKLAEFNPALAAPGFTTQAAAWAAPQFGTLFRRIEPMLPGAVTRLFARVDAMVPAKQEHPERERDALASSVDAFLRRLGVAPRGRSRVISVTFDSGDPILAASAANAVVDGYIANQLKAKQEATSAAHKWLSERVSELREQVLNADNAVETFRERSGLTLGRSGSLIAEQITQTGEQIIRAKAAEAEAEARLNAAVAGRFRAQGLEQAVAAAHERVQSLETLFGQLRSQGNTGNQSEVELHVLQHEADADRALYDRLLLRLQETKIESGLQVADAQLVSRAEAPADPTFPRVPIILAIVLVASCLFAGLIALLLEGLADGFSSTEQMEDQLGFPALGVVPAIRRRLRGARNPETFVLEQPGSSFSETIRGLYTSLLLSAGATSPKVVLIASALPKEGKSSTALALGRLMASCGKRVVIVDCDLHRGRLDKACGATFGAGLVDLLDGSSTLDEVIHKDAFSPASIIPTGLARHVSPDLIGSERMRQALAQLGERYDLVLLDSAPLLAVSDTRNLCRLSDRTVLVVRWQVTKQYAAAAAMRQIVEAGGQLAGCLLTMVDLRRYARYGERNLYQGHLGGYLLD